MTAREWFYNTGFHNHVETTPEPPKPKPATIPVERWDGTKWVTVMVPNPEAK